MLFKVVVPIAEATIYIGTKQGAQTSIYCAIAPELENVTGKYFKSVYDIEKNYFEITF